MTSKPPRISQAEYEALADLRYALRRFLRFSEQAARAAGLEPQQHQALLAIKGFTGKVPITVGNLAERLQVRHHSAVGLVNRLVAEKLVMRQHSVADRREVYLTLTSRSEHLLASLSTAHREQLRRLAPQLKALLERLQP
jgi:DNA-binding MarR family transcriptional regulator